MKDKVPLNTPAESRDFSRQAVRHGAAESACVVQARWLEHLGLWNCMTV